MPRFFHVLCLAAAVLLTACHHTAPSREPKTFNQRMASASRAMKNPFDKQFNLASAGENGSPGHMGNMKFSTKEAGGMKNFGGIKGFHTGEFSQSTKSSRLGTEKSRFGTQDSRFGAQGFKTKNSKFGDKTAHQSGETFRQGNETFKTDDYGTAKKALEQNKRFVQDPNQQAPSEQPREASAYSEDQVRHMLGR